MELGIAGRRALVCGASKGLGYACARSLAREGVAVTIVARDPANLEQAAQSIGDVASQPAAAVAADITTDAGRKAALAACPDPDVLVNNAGGPPPGSFRDWDREDWLHAVEANMLTAIFLIRSVIDGMAERGFGRVVNITSSAVKAPISYLGLSNAARSGLTGFVAGVAREPELARRNVTINNLLPGAFDTDRLASLLDDDARRAKIAAIPSRRLGDPDEFGEFCAFLCSAQAGYITGQNLLIDGGAFPGTM